MVAMAYVATAHVAMRDQRIAIAFVLDVLESAFAPSVYQSVCQQYNEEGSCAYSEKAQLVVCGGDWEEEKSLNVEYDKDYGVNVVLNLELDPGIANGLNTALVCLIFDSIRLFWAEYPVENKWRRRKNR